MQIHAWDPWKILFFTLWTFHVCKTLEVFEHASIKKRKEKNRTSILWTIYPVDFHRAGLVDFWRRPFAQVFRATENRDARPFGDDDIAFIILSFLWTCMRADNRNTKNSCLESKLSIYRSQSPIVSSRVSPLPMIRLRIFMQM